MELPGAYQSLADQVGDIEPALRAVIETVIDHVNTPGGAVPGQEHAPEFRAMLERASKFAGQLEGRRLRTDEAECFEFGLAIGMLAMTEVQAVTDQAR
jgi:hypothetical protein